MSEGNTVLDQDLTLAQVTTLIDTEHLSTIGYDVLKGAPVIIDGFAFLNFAENPQWPWPPADTAPLEKLVQTIRHAESKVPYPDAKFSRIIQIAPSMMIGGDIDYEVDPKTGVLALEWAQLLSLPPDNQLDQVVLHEMSHKLYDAIHDDAYEAKMVDAHHRATHLLTDNLLLHGYLQSPDDALSHLAEIAAISPALVTDTVLVMQAKLKATNDMILALDGYFSQLPEFRGTTVEAIVQNMETGDDRFRTHFAALPDELLVTRPHGTAATAGTQDFPVDKEALRRYFETAAAEYSAIMPVAQHIADYITALRQSEELRAERFAARYVDDALAGAKYVRAHPQQSIVEEGVHTHPTDDRLVQENIDAAAGRIAEELMVAGAPAAEAYTIAQAMITARAQEAGILPDSGIVSIIPSPERVLGRDDYLNAVNCLNRNGITSSTADADMGPTGSTHTGTKRQPDKTSKPPAR